MKKFTKSLIFLSFVTVSAFAQNKPVKLSNELNVNLKDGLSNRVPIKFFVKNNQQIDSVFSKKIQSDSSTLWTMDFLTSYANGIVMNRMKSKYSFKPISSGDNFINWFMTKENKPNMVVSFLCSAKNGYGNDLISKYTLVFSYEIDKPMVDMFKLEHIFDIK